jgi:kanamycin kinase
LTNNGDRTNCTEAPARVTKNTAPRLIASLASAFMSEPTDFGDLARYHALGSDSIPEVVLDLVDSNEPELVWRNEVGGLTFRLGDRFVKWNPIQTGIDLSREHVRLEWLADKHPAPRVVSFQSDDEAQWLVTKALPGELAIGDKWRARRPEAVRAIADGLKALHGVPIQKFPTDWTDNAWMNRTPNSIGLRPPVDDLVLVHGDACAPNTLISEAGEWTGNVDFGDLAVGDRWADLAVASMSLDWNFGEGHQQEFFAAYGISPDLPRIGYYRALWQLES